MRSPLSQDTGEQGRESLKSSLMLQSWKYGGSRIPVLILGHLRFIVITLSNNILRELVLRVVPGPGGEIRMAYTR